MIKFLTASIAATILLGVVLNVLGTETEVMASSSQVAAKGDRLDIRPKFTIPGKVGPTGLIRVTLSYGNASANGLGQLAGSTGSGSWNSNSCWGTWTAERRGS